MLTELTSVAHRSGVVGIDRLNDHRHHSPHTHFIVSGSIDIGKARDYGFRFRRVTDGPGSWADMEAGVAYRGEAGPDGCVFVEGHLLLRPITAVRFLRRGTIVTVPEGTPGSFTTSGV